MKCIYFSFVKYFRMNNSALHQTIWIPDMSRHIFNVFFLSTILGTWKACICVPLKPVHQVVGVIQQPVELVGFVLHLSPVCISIKYCHFHCVVKANPDRISVVGDGENKYKDKLRDEGWRIGN